MPWWSLGKPMLYVLTNNVHFVYISSDCIVFVTEPVFCSLTNVLGNYENLPSPLPLSIKV